MSTTSATDPRCRAGAAVAAAALLALLGAPPSAAQDLYKYRNAGGAWVYSDRQPDPDVPFEALPIARAERAAGVVLHERVRDDGALALSARNAYHGTVQIAFQLTAMQNLAADVPTSGNRILPPRSETDLLTLDRADVRVPMRVEYRFEYIHGPPGAKHQPEQPYRLPYALASRFAVSQAFPETVTHADAASLYAIDFAMPIGTGIYAAREGIVIDVASDYFEAGVDPSRDGPRANIVRILHVDGTMSLYGHLNWNSIRVVPGQRVARGEYLADSGNTGFSTGPHLHFVVQRNAGGMIESVPVLFRGAGGRSVAIAAGDRPAAY
jgi:murein DD-endopeptidase MepM/ murein hydrolase activator NlpD